MIYCWLIIDCQTCSREFCVIRKTTECNKVWLFEDATEWFVKHYWRIFIVANLHLNLERGSLPAGGHLQLPPHPLLLLPHTLHECSYLIQPTYHTGQPMSLGMPNDNLKWQFHKKSPWKVVKWIANQINIFLIPAKNATFELFSFKSNI